ncbi:MAG: RRXRR domain-containing protein [Brasilonema octagenarum HA4186-MV1]|jgi:hypothetical protein|uniref:RRXRR domain-containing protein n=2 Tax=Brasilonema TaxID=383614 RepID=A0A856MEH6_9CYAN|nr:MULTISPECIES: RNA-guided endonuclease IscB [Brasilonema]MBW4624648.1 RRXRR domain-containing protein [Brasilonema octagenarum HA4186-MV1]NMF62953.1 hypothetical protein [Brasilonema octagenarum UFV-OR1]QDL08529.1 hypothetical protein DP114_12065 [Brasilonema sennae CENA114]QDL14884.1 hypothetical protein DP113_12000 [Brasilonema octagenarum UFV-E1]
MSKVFVIDSEKRPLAPIHPAQARQLLRNKKAAVFKRFPFTLILKKSAIDVTVSLLRLKIDPGAKHTGIALVNDSRGDALGQKNGASPNNNTINRDASRSTQEGLPHFSSHSPGEVVFAAELKHRGFAIRESLASRRQIRRSRRNRKTRYRQPRFLNRTRPKGWLAPSLQSRVENIKTWVNKLRKVARIEAISQELVRFDMKKVGVYLGRIATRATGSFNISTKDGLVQGISHKFCKHIHKKDGYSYA